MKRSFHEARRQMLRRLERSIRRTNKQQLRSIPFAPESEPASGPPFDFVPSQPGPLYDPPRPQL